MSPSELRYESYLSFGAAKGGPAAPVVLSESDSHGDGGFDSFEALASKLVQVPKSEVDEQRTAG